MYIYVSFLTQYNTQCGVLTIKLNDYFLTKDNVRLMVEIIQTDLNNKFRDTEKIGATNLMDKLQNIFGESAIVGLDMNLSFYGEEEIEEMLLNEIRGEFKVIVSVNSSPYVDVDEEGSENKIEDIIQQNGIIILS